MVRYGLCGEVWAMWWGMGYVVRYGLCGEVWVMG